MCLGREPSSTEREQLLALLQKARSMFAANAEATLKLTSARGRSASAKTEASTKDLAAWIATTRIILNTDEFITRE